MDSINPPDGWVVDTIDIPDIQHYFWKVYYAAGEGIQVEVYVLKIQDSYQVKIWSGSRTLGYDETIVAKVSTLDEAIIAAFQECKDWDDHIAKVRNKQTQKQSQKNEPTA